MFSYKKLFKQHWKGGKMRNEIVVQRRSKIDLNNEKHELKMQMKTHSDQIVFFIFKQLFFVVILKFALRKDYGGLQ